MKSAFPDSQRHAGAILLLALAAVLAWLLHRNLGLNPAIFADEWYYSKMARLMPLSEAIVPSYLYLWLFRGSLACGDGFLDCVRIGNALFWVGGGAMFYLVARNVMPRLGAIVLAVGCLLAPTNLFTAFFMPEASYYFGFAVLSWVALSPSGWTHAQRALGAGLVVGLMTLVKVHAVFLIPATSLFLALLAWQDGRRIGQALLAAALVPVLAFAVKFGVGYLIAGEPALSVFGSFYGNTASSTGNTSKLALLGPAFINFRGHLMALTLLASLPLAMLLHLLLSRAARRQSGGALGRLQLWTFLMLGSTAGLTVAYTASISGIGPNEVLRLHIRYYAFVLPLLVMLAAAAFVRPAALSNALPNPLLAGARRTAWLVAAFLLAVLAFALWRLPTYAITPVDAPEISGLDLDAAPGIALAALSALVLLLWARGSRHAATVYLFLALPLVLWSGHYITNAYLNQLRPGWPADNGGRFARANVPVAERNEITVATTGILDLMRAQFHIDAPDTGMLDLEKDAPIADYQLPVRKKWLLVIGNHALPPGIEPVKSTAEFALVRLPDHTGRTLGSLHLSQPYGGFVSDAQGLSGAEAWGRWSDAKQVVLHFSQPLPKKALIILTARGYGPNATLPFTIQVGETRRQFRVGPSLQEVGLRFSTDGQQRSVTIEVPQPTSPEDLGGQGDTRKLGIGIAEFAVADVEESVQAAR